jgi:hypothetical protein
LLAIFGLLAAGSASSAEAAEFEIVPGSFVVRMLDVEGHPENRAGSHPDRLEIDFALNVEGTSARDLVFELPPGLGGNPDAVQKCSRELFEAGKEDCPPESQVGTLRFVLAEGGEAELPIFELEPAPGEFLAFASKAVLEAPLRTELRPSDFGITMKASDLPKQAVTEGHMELWGVPADHQVGTAIPRRAMLTTPTRCGPLVFTFRTRSWLEGAPWLSASSDTGAPLEDCANLAFEPALALQLSNPVADSPTGVRMELTAPEEGDASGRADALVEDVTIELPDGITVSPAGAVGLTACSDAQLGLGSGDEAHCPAASKVGTVELASPALSDPLMGTVYIGEERPSERFRLFVVAPGPGVVVKFVGALHVDPVTGRFSATLAGLPQIAFRRLSLNFDGGPGALLTSPLSCGSATAVGKFKPYGGGATVESRPSVEIAARIPGTRCPGPVPFAPQLVARSSRAGLGRSTTLSVRVLRREGEQVPRRFTLTLPAGLSASLGSIQSCSDSELGAGTCPAASRVGGVLAEVGSGSNPVALRGDAYVTGPYRRAPFGLLLQLHASLGPLDLGTMSFRATATVSGRTGRVIVSTDSLPSGIEGIPVRFTAIELTMDRPGLVRNPTSCRPAAVDATIEASGGALATATSPLPLSGCHRLGFRPRFQIALEGGGRPRRHSRHPGLRISAHLRPGDTGLRAMRMVLPHALGFNLAALKAICSRPDAAQGACSPGARVGTAVARTALLGKPLRGGIYIVQPEGSGLPDLGISFAAMGVHIEIDGRTENQDGQFVTKLIGLPDVPFSTFTMHIGGGSNRVLTLGAGLCKRGSSRQFVSTLAATGQDGARRELRVPIETNARCR